PKAHTAHSGSDKDGSKHDGWKKISSEAGLINLAKNGGSGYLTKDITIYERVVIEPGVEVNLCLNGHSITQKTDCTVFSCGEGTFNLFDEKGNSGKITHGSDDSFGEGIHIFGGSFVMNGGTITKNDYDAGAGVTVYTGHFIMNGGIISDNSVGHSGGAIAGLDSEVTINGGTISNNYAYGLGGAIYARNSKVTINGGTISKNTAGSCGGGIYVEEDSVLEIFGGTISKNKSEEAGGICSNYSIFILHDGYIKENSADKRGGGLMLSGNVSIEGGTISKNTAKGDGGGILAGDAMMKIQGGKITGNISEENGGGIYSDVGVLTISGGSISGNTAVLNGGGVYCISETYVRGGKISENTSENGAGFYFSNEGSGYFHIDGASVKDNHASAKGNGLFVDTHGYIIGDCVKDSISLGNGYGSVKFNPNKGEGDVLTQFYIKGDSVLSENTFTRSGFKFYNWNTKADGSGVSFEDGATITGNIKVLYAMWKPTKYTVTFNANGGSGTMTSQKIKYNTSTALTKNTFTNDDAVFKGWNTKADGSGTSYADGAKVKLNVLNINKITLYAQWKPVNALYTVEHYRQKVDGSYPAAANETEAIKGKISTSVTPEVKTYKGFTAPATQTAKIKADGSLVIKYYYTRNSYKLTWDFAGGKASGTYTKGTVKYGAKITAPVPVKDGYVFNGWDKTVPEKMPANNVTYKATWRKPTNEDQVRNFVGRFYTIILERPAEEAGLNDWTGRLLRKEATGAQVAAGFINSDEFQKKKMTDEEYVTKLYRAFFDREPDKGGYEGWLRELKNGKSRDYVLRGFIGSPEFDNLCTKYGINTGSY
nr:DUF4214 domain-containing protein [Lachnospiraceae bacterium]